MIHTIRLFIILLLACTLLPAPDTRADQVDPTQLTEIVRTLASDEFEGRAPGGPGEEKTVSYLVDRFQTLGLLPGGEKGSWTQSVPLIHTQVQAPASMSFNSTGQSQPLEQAVDIAIETSRPLERIIVDEAPVVFVGFGVTAPEREWDDFGDMDLTGKVAVFLVNDPDFAAAPDEPVSGLFGNRRMTYYGRWTYKFEEAERRGAIAALVIHEDKAAAYGWGVAASGPGENYSIVRAPGAGEPVTLQGWLHGDAAAQLFASAGLDLEEQRALARSPEFQAFELAGVTFSANLDVSVERIESQNVLAILPGTTHADEYLFVSSHWDAYGQGEPDAQGRTVRPGANDDALGTAGVLELARVLKSAEPLQRSVVFAVWTAEESGLLGSAAYSADPIYPLEKTVANFTFDIMQTAGPAKDVILVGEGQSDLEDDLERAAASQGRTVTPENLPENGLFFRADHFSMARSGVPVLLIMGIAGGSDLVEGGRAAGDAWIAEYTGNCYHQTCDAWSEDWDLRGAVMDMELFLSIVRDLGDSRRWPQWKPGSEFKAIRAQSEAVRQPGMAAAGERTRLTGTVVVVNQASDTVTLVDLATLEAYKHVAVVGGPHEAAVSPDGNRVMVTNYNKRSGGPGAGPQKTLSLIALPGGTVMKTIDLGEFSMPHDVQWVNGSQVVVTCEANQALLLVNVESGAIERVFSTGRDGSHMLALSPDRQRLYSSNMSGGGSVSVFDFASGEKITDIETGAETEGVGVSPDGRWVWAGNRAEDTVSIIDTESLEVVATLPSPGFPYRVEFTPNGKYALVPHAKSGSLVVGDVAGQAIAKQIPLGLTRVPEPSTAGVFPHPDNLHVFVTVRNDNSLLVVNLETGETLARVEVQSSPDGVAWSPVQR